jgi:hypothetical protein
MVEPLSIRLNECIACYRQLTLNFLIVRDPLKTVK